MDGPDSAKKKNRLSSMFSRSRDDLTDRLQENAPTQGPRKVPAQPPLLGQIQTSRLNKHRTNPSITSDTGIETLTTRPLSTPGLIHPGPISTNGNGSRPNSRHSSPSTSREASRSRPQTPSLFLAPGPPLTPSSRPQTPTSAKIKRKSWLPGKADRTPIDHDHGESKAWIAGLREHVPYDITPLLTGQRTPELWNDNGDTLVYLFAETAAKGPSFRIDSSLLAASPPLSKLAYQSTSTLLGPPLSTDFSRISIAADGSSPTREETHLYLPLIYEDPAIAHPGGKPKGDDLELIVLYRNVFSFLFGGALVSTPRQVTLYSIFMGISSILRRFDFSNSDGSTFGTVAQHSFTRYCDELRLADVRGSREKTIEALVLGESLRSWPLYNEAFVHAVGKLPEIKAINSPKFAQVSPLTANRLERAHMDLENRLMVVRTKLDSFDFPMMFSGIANSTSTVESKLVRFDDWKTSFLDFRKFVLAHYRQRYGAWPPKADSKKNKFEESGLNRLLLREVYRDFTDLYDMLADRTQLTDRTADMHTEAEKGNDINETIQHSLRRIESEYDRSTPPVQPPIPFDVPLLPAFTNSFNRQHTLIPNNSARSTKRLKDTEVNDLLLGSYNRESIKATTWLQDFIKYERKLGHGKTVDEISDMRCGQWLFLYAVLQALPMTVVDARDLQFTQGTEYFLCIAPRGGRPWMKEDTSTSRAWYNVSSGGGVVNLPADVIGHSVEGVYRRSHCWVVAAKWLGQPAISDDRSPLLSPNLPPPPLLPAGISPRGSPQLSPYNSPYLRPVSPAMLDSSHRPLSRAGNRSSSMLQLGLEAIPAPVLAPAGGGSTSRPTSSYNPNTTFDSILGPQLDVGKKKKK